LALACSPGGKDHSEIRFWQFWSDTNTRPIIEQLVTEFEAQNPGIDIKITYLTWANGHDKLVISFAADDPPDIMELGSDWIAEFAFYGLLAEFKSDLPRNYLYPAVWKDTLYALPWLLDTRLLYFNLDLLGEAGAEVPGNWDELKKACGRIDELGEERFGFGCNSAEKHRLYKKYLPFLWSNGGRVLSDDGLSSQLDSESAIEALDFYLDLCDCGVIESQRRLEEYFVEGKIGFVISGGWLLRRLRKSPPEFDYRLVPFFGPNGESGTSFFGGEYLAVNGRSDHLEISKRFAEFLTSKENSQRLCDAAGFGFPPYPDIEIVDTVRVVQVEQLFNSRAAPPTPIWVDIEQDIEDAIEAAVYGHGTAADVLGRASEAIDAKLKSAEYAGSQ
jgi:multiple sugar transport system substrate-binding protein